MAKTKLNNFLLTLIVATKLCLLSKKNSKYADYRPKIIVLFV